MNKILLILSIILLCGCGPEPTAQEKYPWLLHPEAKNVVKSGDGIEFDLRGKRYYMHSQFSSSRYVIEIERKENDK